MSIPAAASGVFVSRLFYVATEEQFVYVLRTDIPWEGAAEFAASCTKLMAHLQRLAGSVPGVLLDLRNNPLPPDDTDVDDAFRQMARRLASSFLRFAIVVRRGPDKELYQKRAVADGISLHVFLNEAFARAYLAA